jgi:hypothetical protein
LLNNILSFFGLENGSLPAHEDFRRKRVRYPGAQAEAVIGKNTYAIRDWDLSGLSFETNPDTCLDAGTEVKMTVKFRFPHEMIAIEQKARILRNARRGVSAVTFTSMPAETRGKFLRALHNIYTRNFLESQVA